ncbi:MAG: hypothetical protein AAF677_11195 [Pseudomonadota bacterium]
MRTATMTPGGAEGRLPGPLGMAGQMLRQGTMAAVGARNTAIDAAVYDTGALTGTEIADLARARAVPGSVLLVGPRPRDGTQAIRYFADADALARAEAREQGRAVAQIAVAGLGASALGAAALARTVADATGRPCAAVVAGYGREDLVAEAFGGMVFFGAAARWKHARRTLQRRLTEIALTGGAARPAHDLPPALFETPEIASLIALMAEPGRRLRLAVAHGRGAVTLAAAYTRLARRADGAALARAAEAQVVTAGAAVGFPETVRWRHQVLGALDLLGRANSDDGMVDAVVPGAGHHLNTRLPLHLDLGRVLAGVLGLAPDATAGLAPDATAGLAPDATAGVAPDASTGTAS